jgi:hypothetical protein
MILLVASITLMVATSPVTVGRLQTHAVSSMTDIHPRVTFPLGSIHSHLTLPEPSYVAAAAPPPADPMELGDRFIAGLPSERSAQG